LATKKGWRKAFKQTISDRTIEAKYLPGEKVHIDGCESLTGVVTAVQWRNVHQISYEVSWIANGDSKHDVIEEWRISAAGAGSGSTCRS